MSAEGGGDHDTKVQRSPIEAHAVKKSKFVMLKGRPCKIMEVKTSKTGKHGHMKCNITGIDVLTGKKYNDVVPGHANMVEFKLDKAEVAVIDLGADFIEYLDDKNVSQQTPIDATSDMYKKIKEMFDAGKQLTVTLVRAPVELAKDKYKDEEQVEAFKEDKADVKS